MRTYLTVSGLGLMMIAAAACSHESTTVRRETVRTVPAPAPVIERHTTVETVPAAPVVERRTTIETEPATVIEKKTTVQSGTIERRTTDIDVE